MLLRRLRFGLSVGNARRAVCLAAASRHFGVLALHNQTHAPEAPQTQPPTESPNNPTTSVVPSASASRLSLDKVMAATTVGGLPEAVVGPTLAKFLAFAPPACFFFLQASNVPVMTKIRNDRSVGQLQPLPFVSLLVNCVVWSLYGYLVSDMTVFAPNFTGALFGLYYTITYTTYAAPGAMRMYLASAVAITASVVGVAAVLPAADAAPLIGKLGVVLAVCMMSSPLAALRTVIRDRNTSSMPLTMSVAVFCNALSWLSYGYLVAHDVLIWCPNLLGLASAIAQLALFAIYPSKPQNGREISSPKV